MATEIEPTEGQRLLVASSKSGNEIALYCGVGAAAVSRWRAGSLKPGPDARRKLQKLLKISPKAWDTPVAADEPEAAPEKRRPGRQKGTVVVRKMPDAGSKDDRPPLPPLSVCSACGPGPLASVRLLVERNQALIISGSLSATEEKALQGQMLDSLKMAANMENQAEIRESTIATHPVMRKLMDAAVAALGKHPDAAEEVLAAWKDLGLV